MLVPDVYLPSHHPTTRGNIHVTCVTILLGRLCVHARFLQSGCSVVSVVIQSCIRSLNMTLMWTEVESTRVILYMYYV